MSATSSDDVADGVADGVATNHANRSDWQFGLAKQEGIKPEGTPRESDPPKVADDRPHPRTGFRPIGRGGGTIEHHTHR